MDYSGGSSYHFNLNAPLKEKKIQINLSIFFRTANFLKASHSSKEMSSHSVQASGSVLQDPSNSF